MALPRNKFVVPGLLTALALAVGGASWAEPPKSLAVERAGSVRPIPFPILLKGAEVHGSVLALVRDKTQLTAHAASGDLAIFLPDIEVYLKNSATSATSVHVQTDLDGAFAFPVQPGGKYVLCWTSPRFVAGCSGLVFTVSGRTVYLKPVEIAPKAGAIYGRVVLKDKSPCRFVAPMFHKDVWTEVKAGATPAVRANSSGYYLASALPAGAIAVAAKCEGAHASGSGSVASVPSAVNLTLNNELPTVDEVIASQGGKMVRAADAGSTVHVAASVTDGGGFALHYSWALEPSGGGAPDSANVNLALPAAHGLVTIYMLAHDDNGGNALWQVPLSTTPHSIRFSGHVLGSDTPRLGGATVNINGVTQVTGAGGDFNLTLGGEAPRYVITITKTGYQMLSRALYAPVVQGTYKLFRADEFTVDPTKTISLTEKPRGQERSGAQILIPPNSLAAGKDGKGRPATAPLHFQMATYNREDANDQVPGDYGGIDKNGKGMALQSYGATDFAFADAGGRPFNLAPGKTALIRIPIDPIQLASAPARIALWHYDETRGMWTEDGVATRNGAYFEAKVTHFSAANMDLAFGPASCTLINIDTSLLPTPLKLQMTVQSGGPAVHPDHQNQILSDAVNAVFREPPGAVVNFQLEDMAGNAIPNAVQTVTVGAPSPEGAMWPAPPPSPTPPAYDCTTAVNFDAKNLGSTILPGANNGSFLTFHTPSAYLSGQGPTLAAQYYNQIDVTPGHAKTAGTTSDFTNFLHFNGFDRVGATVTHVTYQNLYDLGFGRDMYMVTGGRDGMCAACIAFYVSNYKDPDSAAAQTGLIATVAMEFGPVDSTNAGSGASFTRFYVYDNTGKISPSADLDGFGQKFVPALCVVCHNGDIASNATTAALQASQGNLGPTTRFIPFDLDSFGWPSGTGPATYEAGMKTMNAAILNQTNPSTSIVSLVRHWYGSEGDPSLPGNYNGAIVVDGWSSHGGVYSQFVKPVCRACHTTRDTNDPSVTQDLSWATSDSMYTNFEGGIIQYRVCGLPLQPMPQAVRTFTRFWISTGPHIPDVVGTAGFDGFSGTTCP